MPGRCPASNLRVHNGVPLHERGEAVSPERRRRTSGPGAGKLVGRGVPSGLRLSGIVRDRPESLYVL